MLGRFCFTDWFLKEARSTYHRGIWRTENNDRLSRLDMKILWNCFLRHVASLSSVTPDSCDIQYPMYRQKMAWVKTVLLVRMIFCSYSFSYCEMLREHSQGHDIEDLINL